MAAMGGDNLESKMEGLSLADRKALSAKMKSKFTRHDKECALALQLSEGTMRMRCRSPMLSRVHWV